MASLFPSSIPKAVYNLQQFLHFLLPKNHQHTIETVKELKLTLRIIVEPRKRFTQTLWAVECDVGQASTRFEISFSIEALYL